MNAVILCAGFATRMYPLTRDFPKPLLLVADRPVIDYLMDQIAELPGLQAVHVISHRKFIDHYATCREVRKRSDGPEGVRIELHDNGVTTNEKRLGAAADLQLIFKRISEPSRVLVSAGDNIYRISFE